MTILEINSKPQTDSNAAMIHISVDGTEYMIIAARGGWVTVIAGAYWISSQRTLGKCFHNVSDIETHYKKHGKVVLEYANKLLA